MAERRGDGVIMYLTGKDWDALRDGRHPGWPVDGIRLRASDLDLRMDKPNECEWSGVVRLLVTSADPDFPAATGNHPLRFDRWSILPLKDEK